MYHFRLLTCPKCHCPFELNFFGVSSGLGPSEIRCLKCGASVTTGRREWWDMSGWDEVWFFGASLIYIVMLGLLTGNVIDGAYQLWNNDPVIGNLRTSEFSFQVGFCAGVVTAILLQLYRIRNSKRRSRTDYQLTLKEFVFGLQWNLQYKCLSVLILIWAVAKFKYFISN